MALVVLQRLHKSLQIPAMWGQSQPEHKSQSTKLFSDMENLDLDSAALSFLTAAFG
jgi:hypothetical protein